MGRTDGKTEFSRNFGAGAAKAARPDPGRTYSFVHLSRLSLSVRRGLSSDVFWAKITKQRALATSKAVPRRLDQNRRRPTRPKLSVAAEASRTKPLKRTRIETQG